MRRRIVLTLPCLALAGFAVTTCKQEEQPPSRQELLLRAVAGLDSALAPIDWPVLVAAPQPPLEDALRKTMASSPKDRFDYQMKELSKVVARIPKVKAETESLWAARGPRARQAVLACRRLGLFLPPTSTIQNPEFPIVLVEPSRWASLSFENRCRAAGAAGVAQASGAKLIDGTTGQLLFEVSGTGVILHREP